MQVWCRVTLHSNAKVTDARARNLQTYLWSVVGSVPAVLWRSRAHAQRRRQQLQQLQQPAGRMDALGSASSHCRDAWPEEEGGATSDEEVIHFWSFQMFGGRKRKLEEQLFSHTSRSLETEAFWLLFTHFLGLWCYESATLPLLQPLIKTWFMSYQVIFHCTQLQLLSRRAHSECLVTALWAPPWMRSSGFSLRKLK